MSPEGRHPYKIFKRHCPCTARSSFFSERVIEIRNSLLSNAVDFTSLARFKQSISLTDFSQYLSLVCFVLHSMSIGCVLCICMLFLKFTFFQGSC